MAAYIAIFLSLVCIILMIIILIRFKKLFSTDAIIDKTKAQHGMWRTKEKTLFTIALIGGSIGSICGMYAFRHKTKHNSFVYGMPLILIVQIATLIYLWFM